MLKEKEIMRMLDADINIRKTLSSSLDFAVLSARIEALLDVLEYESMYHYESARRDEAMPHQFSTSKNKLFKE